MNEYELTCTYCNHSWCITHAPSKWVVCLKCKDSNLTIRDLSRNKIDYYAGTEPYKEKKEKLKQSSKEEPETTQESLDEDFNRWYTPS